jgi:hypothetical protein
MGFDADTRKVLERFKKWGNANVITIEAFSAVEGMINYHQDARGRLFDELQSALKRDTGIQSPWDSLCDKGLEENERLNNSIASKIPDGLRGIGMSDFYEGEKAVWQACKSGRIGLLAETIYEIGQSDVEVFRKLDEDLKKSREDSKVVDELARAAFGDMSASIRSMAVEVTSGLAAAPVVLIPLIGKVWAPQAKKAAASLLGGSRAVRELARKKAAAKKVLVDNRELVDKAKGQIGDGAIEDLHKRAQDIANSWKGAGSRGDHNADDWGSFGRACLELLANKAVPAIEKAKSLLYTMRPIYVESITTTFVTLMSDPASLESFNGKLSDEVQKMMDDLAKEDVVIASLRDSDPKRSAVAEMKQITADVTEALNELKAALRESQELLKT